MSKTATLRRVLSSCASSSSTSTGDLGPNSLSAVHRGLAFEKRSLRLLQQCLSMSLRHVGGKSDGGVDLQGWWWVPTSDLNIPASRRPGENEDGGGEERAEWSVPRKRIRVFAQCKAEKKKMGPHYVRELEGVLHRYRHRDVNYADASPSSSFPSGSTPIPSPSSQEHISSRQNVPPIVGVLISQSAFTKSALLHATSSAMPFLLLHLPALPEQPCQDAETEHSGHEPEPEPADQASELGSMLLNKALSGSDGPLGGEIEARWERSVVSGRGRPGLWWKGQRIPSWVPEAERSDSSSSED